MKTSWEEQARTKLADDVYDKPILLMPFIENDINDLAINAIVMWQRETKSVEHYAASGEVGNIVEPAIDAYIEANLREKIAELQADYADYIRDQAMDAWIDERQA